MPLSRSRIDWRWSDDDDPDATSSIRALISAGILSLNSAAQSAHGSGSLLHNSIVRAVLDSMTEQTAVFYKEQSEDGLSEGIRRFEATQSRFDESVLRQRAALFSEAAFLKGFERLLDEALSLRGMPASNPGRGQTIATPASFFQDTA